MDMIFLVRCSFRSKELQYHMINEPYYLQNKETESQGLSF